MISVFYNPFIVLFLTLFILQVWTLKHAWGTDIRACQGDLGCSRFEGIYLIVLGSINRRQGILNLRVVEIVNVFFLPLRKLFHIDISVLFNSHSSFYHFSFATIMFYAYKLTPYPPFFTGSWGAASFWVIRWNEKTSCFSSVYYFWHHKGFDRARGVLASEISLSYSYLPNPQINIY